MAIISKITPPSGNEYDIRASAIPSGEVDSTSTSTVFTATVPGITALTEGVCVFLRNGVVTSASGFTLNVNGLGAKPCYNNLTTGNEETPTAATRDTTIFNINYTMLFVYTELIYNVSGGAWICYRGYDANTTYSTFSTSSDGLVPHPSAASTASLLNSSGTWTALPSSVSEFTNDAGYITGMTILSYGQSTLQDFLNAYQANKVVYARASSNANPASGNQTRLAFMAYVNNATTPACVEFQYYRSVGTHTSTQQGDQVFVYTLKNTGWTVTTREASVEVVAGSNMVSTYSNDTITLNPSLATTAAAGIVKPDGTTITVDGNGVISSSGSGSNVTVTTITATLTVAGWSNNTQTVNVAGVTVSNDVIVTYAVESKAAYTAAGIYCTAQGAGTLTFACSTTPVSAITVNVMIIDGGTSIEPMYSIQREDSSVSVTNDGTYGASATNITQALSGTAITVGWRSPDPSYSLNVVVASEDNSVTVTYATLTAAQTYFTFTMPAMNIKITTYISGGDN